MTSRAWLPARRSGSPRPRVPSQPTAARTKRTFSSAPQVRNRDLLRRGLGIASYRARDRDVRLGRLNGDRKNWPAAKATCSNFGCCAHGSKDWTCKYVSNAPLAARVLGRNSGLLRGQLCGSAPARTVQWRAARRAACADRSAGNSSKARNPEKHSAPECLAF